MEYLSIYEEIESTFCTIISCTSIIYRNTKSSIFHRTKLNKILRHLNFSQKITQLFSKTLFNVFLTTLTVYSGPENDCIGYGAEENFHPIFSTSRCNILPTCSIRKTSYKQYVYKFDFFFTEVLLSVSLLVQLQGKYRHTSNKG